MTQKGLAPILVVILLAVALTGISLWIYKNNPTNHPTACPQDAKVCPDGTTVGRVGPHCDFASCPAPTIATESADMTNWKTYDFAKYGVSFLAPNSKSEGFHQDLFNTQHLVVNPKANKGCQAYGIYDDSYSFADSGNFDYGISISIFLPLNKVTDSITWYNACLEPLYKNSTTEATSINGKQILIMKIRSSQSSFDRYILVNNGIVYDFGFPYPLTSLQEQQAQQILQSIKFAKPTIQ